ncbi:MAG: hypothetical protein AAF250_13285 [Pseudomonadota bacterium]
MNAQSLKSPGILGRGPAFWGALFAVASALLGILAFTGAIDNRGALMVLLTVPAVLLFAVILSAHRKARNGNTKGTAQARYVKRVAIFTSLYLATFAAMTFLDEAFAPPEAVRFFIAVLPGLAISGIFWAIGRLIVEEPDEFLRMLTIRQSLIASAIALSTASIWGFLEAADLVFHVDAYWVAIAWFFGLFIGAVANRIQYGTWGAA